MILVSVLGGLIVFSVGTPDIFAGALSVNDVQWILAESGETPAQACIRNNLNVLFAESNAIPWDQAALSTVADDILGLGISTNSSVSYGISGCCAPGMWCDSTGCFTQSFGEAFSNYGWLNGDISSVPVYACRGTATGNGSLISSAQFQTNGSLVDVLGSSNSFTFPDGIPLQGVTEMFIYSESCSNVEVCNCKDCLADPSVCPVGEQCYSYMFQSNEQANCFTTCAGEDDQSCPCGQTCSSSGSSSGSSGGSAYLCLPASTDIYTQQCVYSGQSWRLSCQPQRAFQQKYRYSFSEGNYNFSTIIEGTAGVDDFVDPEQKSGFCSSDADCADGNICTSDTCNSVAGECSYATVAGCSSIPRPTSQRQAPYMYYTFYRSDNASSPTSSDVVATAQATALAAILMQGDNITSVENRDLLHEVNLPFNITYFGNLVDKGYVSETGVLALPPIAGSCPSEANCNLFSSASNVVSPWSSSGWNTSNRSSSGGNESGSLYVLTQLSSSSVAAEADTSDTNTTSDEVFGIDADAFHVLFNDFRKENDSGGNTFAVSLYSDSSIRLSYIDISSTVDEDTDFQGLWGSFTSDAGYYAFTASPTTGSFLRYHLEQLTSGQAVSGSEVLYCPLTATACAVEACVAAGDVFSINWPDTGVTTCAALGGATQVAWQYICAWAGGVETTVATFNTTGSGDETSTVLSCAVPSMTFPDNSVVVVDILITAVDANSSSSSSSVVAQFTQNFNDLVGTKGIYAAALSSTTGGGELTRSPLMVRYFSSAGDKPGGGCGCSALPGLAGAVCDTLGVCGGDDTTADCAGVAFGSAITTGSCTEDSGSSTDSCTGGTTGVAPDFTCDGDDDGGGGGGGGGGGNNGDGGSSTDGTSSIVSQTIILLMIICCMTFITMALSYSIRRMLAIRALNESLAAAEAEVLQFEMSLLGGGLGDNGAGVAAQRGLTEFECDALGQVTFTKQFYKQHLEEQAALIKAKSPEKIPPAGASADGDIEGGEAALGIAGATGAAGAASADACDCAICLCEIEEGSVCRVLPEPCGHVFHKSCIDQWFKQSAACPMCKRSMRAILVGEEDVQVFNSGGSAVGVGGRGGSGGGQHGSNGRGGTAPPSPGTVRDYYGGGSGGGGGSSRGRGRGRPREPYPHEVDPYGGAGPHVRYARQPRRLPSQHGAGDLSDPREMRDMRDPRDPRDGRYYGSGGGGPGHTVRVYHRPPPPGGMYSGEPDYGSGGGGRGGGFDPHAREHVRMAEYGHVGTQQGGRRDIHQQHQQHQGGDTLPGGYRRAPTSSPSFNETSSDSGVVPEDGGGGGGGEGGRSGGSTGTGGVTENALTPGGRDGDAQEGDGTLFTI